MKRKLKRKPTYQYECRCSKKGLDVTLEVYYESIKREPKIRGIKKCRCDERLQTKTKEFTRLPYTGLSFELWSDFFFLGSLFRSTHRIGRGGQSAELLQHGLHAAGEGKRDVLEHEEQHVLEHNLQADRAAG